MAGSDRALRLAIVSGCLAMILVGCGRLAAESPVPTLETPPTISPLFQIQPTLSADTLQRPLATPSSGSSSSPSLDEQIKEVTIFDEAMADGWTLGDSQGTDVNEKSRGHSKSGIYRIAVTPSGAEDTVQFSLTPESENRYLRNQVLGISFWVSSKTVIAPDSLLVTVMGSNAYPYYVEGDTSVRLNGEVTDGSPIFSETRLYYLDINHSIPPNTWVEIVLWLDDRQFDPNYRYLTGFYIKNDLSFQDTFYVDRVSLLLRKR